MSNTSLQSDDHHLIAEFLSGHDIAYWLDTLDIEARSRIGEYLKQKYGIDCELRITPLKPPPQRLPGRLTSEDKREILSPDFPDSIDLMKHLRWATVYQQAFSFDMEYFSAPYAGEFNSLRLYLIAKLAGLVRVAKQPQILEHSCRFLCRYTRARPGKMSVL